MVLDFGLPKKSWKVEFLGFWKVPVWHLLSCSGCRLYINFWRQHSSSFCHSASGRSNGVSREVAKNSSNRPVIDRCITVYRIYTSENFISGSWKTWSLEWWFDVGKCGSWCPFDPLNFYRNSFFAEGMPSEIRSQVVHLAFRGLLWIVARWVSKRRISITTWKCVLPLCSPLSTSCSFFCQDTFF